jgi:predicted O-linked N-acetylglucosamine transferase (SPINDLY family)
LAQPPSRRPVLEDALAHLRGGRPRDALRIVEAEIRQRGEDRDLLFVCALALEDLDQADQALKAYERLLASAPAMAEALHNRGLLLVRLGRFREAEENHRQYVREYPDSPQARVDLADILLAASRYEEAVSHIDAIAEGNLSAPALVTRALALASLGRFSEAASSIARAKERDPAGFDRHVKRIAPNGDPNVIVAPENVFLWRGYTVQQQCHWSEWERYTNEFRNAANNAAARLEPALTFAALHVPLTPRDRLALARRAANHIEAEVHTLPHVAPREQARVRVGILSPDFRDHLNARLLLPLFELCDRRRLELIAYSLAAGDGSAILKRIKTAAGRFVDLASVSDASGQME